MKKLLIMLLVCSNSLLIAGSTNADIRATMQVMEDSMATIQKGFLYNHKGRIQMGVESLRKELKNIDSFVIKNNKDTKFNAKAYAINETKALDKMASGILQGFIDGKKDQVMQDYQQMLNRCVTCHALVRKW